MHSDEMTPCEACGRLIETGRLCYQCAQGEMALVGSDRFAQLDLFDGLQPRYETKEQAIARVESNANAAWLEAARAAAIRLAEMRPTFTSDDIWDALEWQGVTTHEPKAMGAVLNGLGRAGIIRKTGRYIPTRRAIAHGRDLAEWTLNQRD